MSADIQIGKTYKVNSSRKGIFDLLVSGLDDVWVSGLIMAGKAGAMLDYNEREVGEQITVRRSLCTFTEIQGSKP